MYKILISLLFVTIGNVLLSQVTNSYTYTGSGQSYTVPTGVTSITVKIWGAGGGGSANDFYGGGGGGSGAFVMGTLSVTPGNSITVIVGNGGAAQSSTALSYGGGAVGGGGTYKGGCGGGRSSIQLTSGTDYMTGGGGGGGSSSSIVWRGGGGGGYTTGAGGSGANGGGGATSAAAGIAGANGGSAGSGTSGGSGGVTGSGTNYGGGGGGGGYYGGGGGGKNGSGGGGSSFINAAFTSILGYAGNSVSSCSSGNLAVNTSDANYSSGIGAGGAVGTSGGNGRVVIIVNPVITTSVSLLSAFSSCSNVASSTQSLTVTGSALSANLTVTAPAGFEVSTASGSGFGSSVSLTPTSGTVSSTSIYVRMASLASSPSNGTIVCSSTGATSVNVAVSGSLKSSPTITTTTASSITSSSASSGGVSISAGSGTISAKGVCYAASPTTNPTTSNSTVSGGTGTANFTSALTSLSAATRYYYNAYATNECGTSYGTVANFWTLSAEPTGHSTTFSATAVSPTQINLSFLPASTYGADGYIILVFQGASAPTSAGVTDGVAPGSLIGFSPTGATYLCTTSTSATSYSHTTCSILSQYYYTLIPFNWNEVNTETYNYLTTATIPTCTATTLTGPSTEGYYISGNIVNNGTINETSDINYLRMTGSSKTISGTGTWTGAKLCIDGTISFGGAALTSVVNAGSTITELFVLSNTFTLYANQTFPVTNITNYATITDQTGSTLNVENTNNYNALNLNGTGIINNTVNWVNGTNGTVTVAATGKINVGGNWTNNGTFTAGTGTVEFNGNNSLQTASGSGATAFYNVIVNKGSNASNILEANGVGALSNSGNITITNGVFKMTTGIWQFNAAPTIPSTGGLIVNGATLNSGNFSYTNNGLIRVLSGTAAFGTASGNDLTNSNAALFDVQGGTVSFSGRLYNSANGTAPTGYSSTGVSISGTPTITICSVGNNSASLASFHMTTTSNLSFTGGTVILQNPNTNGTPFNDIEILSGGTKSISGGTFQIGNASTATAKTFIVNSAIPIYNFTVNATNSPKVNLVTSNLTVSSTLAMNGGDVTMSTDATVLGTLTLTSGKLIVGGGKTLSIGNTSANGTISGGSSSSYIVAYKDLTTAATGTLKRFVNLAAATTYNLPIGDATSYTPMTFLLNSATLSSAYISVFTKAAKIATMNASVTNYLNRYWDLTPSGITGTVNYRVDYTYAEGDIVGVDDDFFPVKRSLTGSTYTWYKPGGTPGPSFSSGTEQGIGQVNPTTNVLSWRLLSTFSQFSAAGDEIVNLPIDLLSFDAKKQNQNNLLFWSTATETNSDYFTIEKTLDGASYEVVGNVNGGGTTYDVLNYSLVDYDVRKAINYYRLKQTDTDGTAKISALVSVDNRENLGKVISMKTNLLGQEINENYRGVVIVIFEDGTSIKIIQ